MRQRTRHNVSRTKVALGYLLLLGALAVALFTVWRETGTLMRSGKYDVQWADSLLQLVEEKDENTISLLRTLGEAQKGLLSATELERLLTAHDSATIRPPRIQQHTITRHDTIVTRPKKKGFFRRLGEVFAPPRHDTAIQVRTSTEYITDTIPYSHNDTLATPIDSLQEQLRAAARRQEEANALAQRRRLALQRIDRRLTARIDSLVKNYEQATLDTARAEAHRQQEVRQRSARTIGGIAAAAVILAAVFLAIIGRDITRSNRYRCQLEEARRHAEDLLATRERMMLAITHDFKAPLGSIIGYADLLSRLTVDERQRFYLDNMKTSSQHLLKLVVDLLDFHRLDLHKAEIQRVAFHPAKLIEEIYTSFKPLADAKGLTLECHTAPQLDATYICDPLRLRQIANNLLSNAIKFTDWGTVTITASYTDRKLILSISDTGKGMSPADCERIFQEFTRLPDAQGKEGFGLGLSIVRMLVQLLEGDIRVDSTLGKGSIFTVHIPIYPVSTATAANISNRPTTGTTLSDGDAIPQTGQPLRVLLIDDDRIQLELTSAMLRQHNISAVCCLQIDELLDALRQSTFDVLLTDVQMPAINGFDLLNLLRASNIPQAQTIPVIAVTARSDMQRKAFTEHGFSGCLHKPFNMQELLAEIGHPTQSNHPKTTESTIKTKSTAGQPQEESYDFDALTQFSGNDKEASQSIMDSFINETRLNATHLAKALENNDINEASATAHKMLPLFRLIKATQLVEQLQLLERTQSPTYTDALKQTSVSALTLINLIIKKAEHFMNSTQKD